MTKTSGGILYKERERKNQHYVARSCNDILMCSIEFALVYSMHSAFLQ